MTCLHGIRLQCIQSVDDVTCRECLRDRIRLQVSNNHFGNHTLPHCCLTLLPPFLCCLHHFAVYPTLLHHPPGVSFICCLSFTLLSPSPCCLLRLAVPLLLVVPTTLLSPPHWCLHDIAVFMALLSSWHCCLLHFAVSFTFVVLSTLLYP